MTKAYPKRHRISKNLLTPNAPKMEVEFGSEWAGDAKRAVNKVETRVKTTAQRYGFFEEEE